MFILHIEHRAPNYDDWKKQFDSDPIGRERVGVRRYRVLRLVEDPTHLMVDLEFETEREARAALDKLRALWERIASGFVSKPQARILEAVEARELKPAGAPMDK